jgi:hypothetical protein
MTNLNDILSLAEASERLENRVSASTLKQQAKKGVLRARCIGKTWITTTTEVDRYGREHLGRLGRPEGAKDSRPRKRGD